MCGGPETGAQTFGESISQGWRAHQSHEVGEKARDLRRVSASFGRKAACHTLGYSGDPGRQVRLQLERSWEEKRPPRGGPGRPRTGVGNRRQGALGASALGASYPAGGAKGSFGSSEVLSVAGLSLRAQGGCSGLRARAGGGFEVWSEKTLEGKKPRRVSAR